MTVLYNMGDGLKGTRIVCIFRRITKPVLISGSHRHRAQRAKIEGVPAEAWIEKTFRYT